MKFSPETITIYSTGLLGGSIGAGLKKSGYTGKIIGLSSPGNLKTALQLRLIDEGYTYESLPQVVKRTDLLILCSPILAVIQTIEQLSDLELPEGLIISDVGSTKNEIVSRASELLPAHVDFIGGHPMAGSEKSGPSSSDPYLFQNAIYVLTPAKDVPLEKSVAFAEFLERYLGCRHLVLDPETHDKIAASVSHLPHILASALVLTINQREKSVPGTLDLAAGGFRDMTRIASAPYSMWHDILVTNKKPVTEMIDAFINTLCELKNGLQNDSLKEYFETARKTRENIPFANKGFIGRLSEILVMAEDRPGFIAEISVKLAQANINIKDIEVLKVREGEGGTIRLAFDSHPTALEAVSVLSENGFSARERI